MKKQFPTQKQPFADVLQNRCSEKCPQENTCVEISFLIKLQPLGLQLYLKKTPTQVFSCEYCEIFKNSLFNRTTLVASSAPGVIQMYFHNSGMVGCRKLPDSSLNRILNALSIVVQYVLSFQWTNFSLKWLRGKLCEGLNLVAMTTI